ELMAAALFLAGGRRAPSRPAQLSPILLSPSLLSPAGRPRGVRPVMAGAFAATATLLLGSGSIVVAAAMGVAAAAATRAARRGTQAAAHSTELREAPLFLDVVASQLRAGAPVALALERAAPLAPASVADAVREVAGLVRLGAPPTAAWRPLDDGVLGDLAVLARRSADSGVRLADQTRRLAVEMRQQSADRSQAAARRAGVWVMAPLGLCFLPAFFCLGVLPMILGLASSMLTD
ncbi:MAG: Type secretion system domain protein, partial [Jatrophihabitantaceae bacterium]|nr:Type secretion system domain protein [Jatrophihabitantaceae bacterium]